MSKQLGFESLADLAYVSYLFLGFLRENILLTPALP